MAEKSDKHHEADRSESGPKVCRNCGQEVPKLYCTWCGQSVKEIRGSFKSLFFDFLGEYFTLDSKLFRSIVPLFFKPGFLTFAFLDGKRVRYIPPLRLYIFSSILFFLTLAIVSGGNEDRAPVDAGNNTNISQSGSEAGDDEDSEVDNELPATNKSKTRGTRFTDARFSKDTQPGRYLNKRLDALDRKIQEMGFDAFMRTLVKEFLSSLPKALFLLMPFFALLLKLCYFRSDPLYIDHLIFAFHYHAFVYGLTSLLLVIGSQTDGLLAFSIVFGFFAYPIYLLLAMKRVFAQGWLWTLIKFFIISIIYFTILALFVPLVFFFIALFLV